MHVHKNLYKTLSSSPAHLPHLPRIPSPVSWVHKQNQDRHINVHANYKLFRPHASPSFNLAPSSTFRSCFCWVSVFHHLFWQQVFVPPHPLIKHWVSVLRNEQTPPPIFKNAMAELGRLLMYEASRDWLPTVSGEIQSPLGVASVEFIDPRDAVAVVPILRAGLALAEHHIDR